MMQSISFYRFSLKPALCFCSDKHRTRHDEQYKQLIGKVYKSS